jgi:hypothetical protein
MYLATFFSASEAGGGGDAFTFFTSGRRKVTRPRGGNSDSSFGPDLTGRKTMSPVGQYPSTWRCVRSPI